MSKNYASEVPHDANTVPLPNYPSAKPSLQRTTAVPPAASSVVSLSDSTTVVEISALNGAIAFKWGSASVIAIAGATANYDHVVPINTVRRFVVPIQKIPDTGSVMGANGQNGLYSTLSVITMSSTLSSITEY